MRAYHAPRTSSRTNRVANGGFETNTTGWTSVDGRGAISRVTNASKFGSASLYVQADSAAFSGARYTLTLNAGTYTVSCFILPDGTVQKFGFNVYNATAGSTLLDSDEGAITGSDWVRKDGTFTVVGSAQSIQVNFDVNYSGTGNTDAMWLDGVQVETDSIATPYIETDGDAVTETVVQQNTPSYTQEG